LGSRIKGFAMTLSDVDTRMTMVYWKSDQFWLGKLLEHPEIMTQGETLDELEENLKDAYLLMAMDDVPSGYEIKEIRL
jgi:predicted RNase H-like HicB family nuclease